MNSTDDPTGTGAGPSTGSGTGTATPPPAPGPYDGPRVSHEDMRDLSRLSRSKVDRKVAGVAAGIARHFDIDPLIVRVAFVVLVFFGGGGLLLYGAAWLLVPEDDGDAVVALDDRSRAVALIIVGVLAALSIVGDAFGGWSFPLPLAVVAVVLFLVLRNQQKKAPPGYGARWDDWRGWLGTDGRPGSAARAADPAAGDAAALVSLAKDDADEGPSYRGYVPPRGSAPRSGRPGTGKRGPILFGYAAAVGALALGVLLTLALAGVDVPAAAYPAVVMGTCGAFLLLGAFWGRAGGLILVGLLAAGATAVATVGDDLDSFDMGQVKDTPQSAAALDESYELGIGEIDVDLTEIEDLENLDGDELRIALNVGHVIVTVPEEGLDVEVDSTIDGAGESALFGTSTDGSADAQHDGGVGAPTLTIITELDLGQVELRTKEAA